MIQSAPHRHRRETDLRTLAPGWAVPVPDAERPVRVVSVVRTGAHEATWTFDGQIFEVWDTISELQLSADGVSFVPPLSTDNAGLFQFVATYPAPVSAGCVFRIATQLESMTFLFDKLLALPQGGVVTAAPAMGAEASSIQAVPVAARRKAARKRRGKHLQHHRRAA